MSKEIHRDRWLASLPENVRELLQMSNTQMNDFSDNVRIGDYMAKLAFQRTVEAIETNRGEVVELGDPEVLPERISDGEINARMSLAIKANESSARLKEQRITLIDKYESVNDIPVPMNIDFHIVESTQEQQKERLKVLGRYKEEDADQPA